MNKAEATADMAVRMQTLIPTFDYANLSDRVTRGWVKQVKECYRLRMERWYDKGVNEAFPTHKLSIECFDAEGRRIGGQKLFKLRTSEAQLRLMTYLQTERNEFVNIAP